MTLTKDIREAIEKNLPSATASVLGDYITGAESDRKQLPILVQALEDAKTRERTKDAQFADVKSKLTALEARETAIRDAERQILIAQKDVQTANASQQATERVVAMVFANTQVKRTIFESGSTSVPGTNGYAQNLPTNTQRTETTEG